MLSMVEEDKPEEEAKEEPKQIQAITDANEAAERLEKANEVAKEIAAKNILSGHAEAGAQPVDEKKEDTPQEYKDKVMSGEIGYN